MQTKFAHYSGPVDKKENWAEVVFPQSSFPFCQQVPYCTLSMVVAAIVLGFLVAYAAMFGFDKLKETLEGIRKK